MAKHKLSSFQIEQNMDELVDKRINPDSFIYDVLLAYGLPKASITRLKEGTYNKASKAKQPDAILYKDKVFFKALTNNLHGAIDTYRNDPLIIKQSPRFIIVTDFIKLLAIDTKTQETLETPIEQLNKHHDFFLPWVGIEKNQHIKENRADRKAAERMAKLYDAIVKENTIETKADRHGLNVFLCRVLFCFFAEDTEIFPDNNMFTTAIKQHTQENGEDLPAFLNRLFKVMNTPSGNPQLSHLGTMLEPLNDDPRSDFPSYLQKFPYVNGGLFKENYTVPKFTAKARNLLIESGGLNWSEINPDIFGSMMQAVVDSSERGALGMHYTSVPNIKKVIEPLFLNELTDAFEKAKDNKNRLQKLHQRIKNIKLFDPACGSGNFLIIAYKELRRLEMKIFEALRAIDKQAQLAVPLSEIQLSQLYGIEIDDFAHEVATLSLWLAEHQVNVEFKALFGECRPPLPLGKGGHIAHGNATRLDWGQVCPKGKDDEIYILGNPPYLGTRNQKKGHKEDLKLALSCIPKHKSLDYIAIWFYKGAQYIKGANAKLALVSTNSICQGDQVSILWPYVLGDDIEIDFAYSSFKWLNSAKGNAGVTCVIIGLANKSSNTKLLFTEEMVINTKSINPYLVSGKTTFLERNSVSLFNLPKMIKGSIPADGGHLILNKEAFQDLIKLYQDLKPYLKKFVGASELINGLERWCLFFEQKTVSKFENIPEIKQRFEGVKKMRLGSTKKATNILAKDPYKFAENRYHSSNSLIIPCHSSDKRHYIPIGFIEEDSVIYASAQAIYDPEPWIFSVISSKMHMAWVKAVAGRLEERIRYSSTLCYNTFPFPSISDRQQETLTHHVFNVLGEREQHPEKTIAQLYDPDKMPDGLRQAHRDMDLAIERCYRSKPFTSDEERLAYLFKLYEEMTQPNQLELTTSHAK